MRARVQFPLGALASKKADSSAFFMYTSNPKSFIFKWLRLKIVCRKSVRYSPPVYSSPYPNTWIMKLCFCTVSKRSRYVPASTCIAACLLCNSLSWILFSFITRLYVSGLISGFKKYFSSTASIACCVFWTASLAFMRSLVRLFIKSLIEPVSVSFSEAVWSGLKFISSGIPSKWEWSFVALKLFSCVLHKVIPIVFAVLTTAWWRYSSISHSCGAKSPWEAHHRFFGACNSCPKAFVA